MTKVRHAMNIIINIIDKNNLTVPMRPFSHNLSLTRPICFAKPQNCKPITVCTVNVCLLGRPSNSNDCGSLL